MDVVSPSAVRQMSPSNALSEIPTTFCPLIVAGMFITDGQGRCGVPWAFQPVMDLPPVTSSE
ncbi:unannotated protein [freshwater metagenome]|uniref:Unannotated protein n=1 Tax=freshwater metagenome TaxID=449393 RepID=A0A6J5Z7V7_9ZZZZ